MTNYFYQYQGSFTGTADDSYFIGTATCPSTPTVKYAINGYCGALNVTDNENAHVVYEGPGLSGTGGATNASTQWVCWIAHGRTSAAVNVRYGVLCQ